ncbi:hypothetical protein OH77DRAFT_415615 [Trametes cingulata]|nr:hypothetical protein OH77DRAFT_415615 [Trametes cingulata]
MRKMDDHRFLCPRNALGRPVRIRSAPSTPNPGSMWVSSLVKSGAAEVVADGWAEDVEDALTEFVGVTVTLKTTGMAVVIGMFWLPERMVVVTVVKLVVRESETELVLVGEGVAVVLLFWASAGARSARRTDSGLGGPWPWLDDNVRDSAAAQEPRVAQIKHYSLFHRAHSTWSARRKISYGRWEGTGGQGQARSPPARHSSPIYAQRLPEPRGSTGRCVYRRDSLLSPTTS